MKNQTLTSKQMLRAALRHYFCSFILCYVIFLEHNAVWISQHVRIHTFKCYKAFLDSIPNYNKESANVIFCLTLAPIVSLD